MGAVNEDLILKFLLLDKRNDYSGSKDHLEEVGALADRAKRRVAAFVRSPCLADIVSGAVMDVSENEERYNGSSTVLEGQSPVLTVAYEVMEKAEGSGDPNMRFLGYTMLVNLRRLTDRGVGMGDFINCVEKNFDFSVPGLGGDLEVFSYSGGQERLSGFDLMKNLYPGAKTFNYKDSFGGVGSQEL